MVIIDCNPKILGGKPCFTGTRVPVEILFEYLRTGSTIDEFLTQFPTVSRELAVAVLLFAEELTISASCPPGLRPPVKAALHTKPKPGNVPKGS